MKSYEMGVKSYAGLIYGPPVLIPGVIFSNQWRNDQGLVAVICMTIAAKSHFDARSRHVFETNEQCRSEPVSSCS